MWDSFKPLTGCTLIQGADGNDYRLTCLDVADSTLHYLAALINSLDEIRQAAQLPALERPEPQAMEDETLWDHIQLAVWLQTSLLAFLAGAEWQEEDPKLILKLGEAGYDQVTDRYRIRQILGLRGT